MRPDNQDRTGKSTRQDLGLHLGVALILLNATPSWVLGRAWGPRAYEGPAFATMRTCFFFLESVTLVSHLLFFIILTLKMTFSANAS